MPLSDESREELLRSLRIVSTRLDEEDRVRLDKSVRNALTEGQWPTSLPFNAVPWLLYPSDPDAARQLRVTMEHAAVRARTLMYEATHHGEWITATQLSAWSDCPRVPMDSPLRFWLPKWMHATDSSLSCDTAASNYAESSKPGDPAVSDDQAIADLFDAVRAEALEKMFPADGRWKNWCNRAARNGLIKARAGTALFNPYLASRWFLTKNITGWDQARVQRTLKNNLPPRSIDTDHPWFGQAS